MSEPEEASLRAAEFRSSPFGGWARSLKRRAREQQGRQALIVRRLAGTCRTDRARGSDAQDSGKSSRRDRVRSSRLPAVGLGSGG